MKPTTTNPIRIDSTAWPVTSPTDPDDTGIAGDMVWANYPTPEQREMLRQAREWTEKESNDDGKKK